MLLLQNVRVRIVLELCSALSEGGSTPSFGLIEPVLEVVDIPVHVIVRPHNRGFHYTKHDVAVMKKDIQMIKTLGAAGIVIGPLRHMALSFKKC